jgi:hypothetical protein
VKKESGQYEPSYIATTFKDYLPIDSLKGFRMGIRIGCPSPLEKAWMDSTFGKDDSSSTREIRYSAAED